jgi:transaldolase
MQLFLDSAKVDEIRHALEYWDLDGLTTNPRHVRDSGKPFRKVIGEIAEIFAGTQKPVSVEVNPHLTDWEQIVNEGLELSRISPNFVVKVGAGEAGFKAMRELARQGVRTNATLIFSAAQAWHAARCGAYFVSPFVGWKEAHGEDTVQFIPEIARLLANFDYPTKIIAAAMRNPRHLAAAALAGAHCVTAGFAVYQDSFKNPYSDLVNNQFCTAWDATPRE